MYDTMNESVQFSKHGGELILEHVSGTVSGNLNPENNVDTVIGADRDMYAYVPKCGVPHAKQAQVLMVLRDKSTKESAEELMSELKLKELADKYRFVLLFPNPLESGWDYNDSKADTEFLIRCFASLKKSEHGCAGFNGMIFYLSACEEASALLMNMSIATPMDVAAMMIGRFPLDYKLPQSDIECVCWVYDSNEEAVHELCKRNDATLAYEETETKVYTNAKNNCVKVFATKSGLNRSVVEEAWDKMFSETRRWRNDTYGTYQPRINFDEKGYVAHVRDTSLHVNNEFAHTWYEYAPSSVKNSEKKVPLVIYLHGINCIALYGAEQSGWSAIAEREGFVTVYPNPSIEERWNVWDDPRLPSDSDFIMALIEHMKQTYPIDESRIYVSGFSMGSMYTNAISSQHPEVFAGAVALNGPHLGYLATLDASKAGMVMFRPTSVIKDLEPSEETTSKLHKDADAKKAMYDYRMPFMQFVGVLDGVGFTRSVWPAKEGDKNTWVPSMAYWRNYNHMPMEEDPYDPSNTISGLKAATITTEDRYVIHDFESEDHTVPGLYRLVVTERMPHAVSLEEVEMGWAFVSQYRRNKDGSLEKI